jgi:hypothetical protein
MYKFKIAEVCLSNKESINSELIFDAFFIVQVAQF